MALTRATYKDFASLRWINKNIEELAQWIALADPSLPEFYVQYVQQQGLAYFSRSCSGEPSLLTHARQYDSGKVSLPRMMEVAIENGCSLLDCFIRPASSTQNNLFDDPGHMPKLARPGGVRLKLASMLIRHINLDDRIVAEPPIYSVAAWLGISRSDAARIATAMSYGTDRMLLIQGRFATTEWTYDEVFKTLINSFRQGSVDVESLCVLLERQWTLAAGVVQSMASTCSFIDRCIRHFGVDTDDPSESILDLQDGLDLGRVELEIKKIADGFSWPVIGVD